MSGNALFFCFCFLIVYFFPYYLGNAENFEEANPLVTPPHIKPEWYFLFMYAILRSIPNKAGGISFKIKFSINTWMPLTWFDQITKLVLSSLMHNFKELMVKIEILFLPCWFTIPYQMF